MILCSLFFTFPSPLRHVRYCSCENSLAAFWVSSHHSGILIIPSVKVKKKSKMATLRASRAMMAGRGAVGLKFLNVCQEETYTSKKGPKVDDDAIKIIVCDYRFWKKKKFHKCIFNCLFSSKHFFCWCGIKKRMNFYFCDSLFFLMCLVFSFSFSFYYWHREYLTWFPLLLVVLDSFYPPIKLHRIWEMIFLEPIIINC